MNGPIRDDSHSDYHAIKTRATESMRRGVWTNRFAERFVPFDSRELRSDLSKDSVRAISEGKHYITYQGLPMGKDPFDIVLYEMLFFELQPKTVIELGAYTGASAMWMAQTLRLLNIEARVLAVDIDLSLIDPRATKEPTVEFLEGDCHNVDRYYTDFFGYNGTWNWNGFVKRVQA